MISWLNFEELLIHNPIELINFSKSSIQVALSKKQYIDFFSNKAVYMGLYYDEEMDFCVMFYADPLQSSKNGEMYAEGYIDVDMKIYRVKVLSNVSIKYPPNFNLLEGTKDFSGWWGNTDGWTNDGTYKGLTVKKRTWQFAGIFKQFTVQKDGVYTFSAYIKASGDNANIRRYVDLWDINGEQKWDERLNNVFVGNNFDWKRYSFTLNLKKGDTIRARHEITGSGTLWTAGHKLEEGSVATPYMQTESETTSSDLPKWNVTKTGMLVSPQTIQITMVQAGALMKCEINNNISGWTDGTTQLNYSGQDFIIDGYGMRGLHNG